MTRRAAAATVLLLALAQHGCAVLRHTLFAPRLRECEGFDAPLSALAGSSRKELRVRLVGRRLDQDIPFVVESSPASFVLVAFTPLGTKSFTLVRRGEEKAEVESMTGPVLPVPPRNIMADVLAMSVPSACLNSPDGVAVSTAGEWEVRDTCKDARPVERGLARPGGEVEVEVRYSVEAVVVTQKACRYTARYVWQGAAPDPDAEAGGEEDEEEVPGAGGLSGAAAGSAPPR
jgi:hypothetical protein